MAEDSPQNQDPSNQTHSQQAPPNQTFPQQKLLPLAVAILQEIQSGKIDPNTLTDEKRRLCVRFLLHEQKYTRFQMAQMLGVCEMTITRDKKKIYLNDALAQLVIDESEIAREAMDAAEHTIANLVMQKKYKDAWTVRRECIELLQSLGYVKKVEQTFNVKGSLNLMQVLDIEAELRKKESPENGDEDGNSNGHPADGPEGGSRLEEVPG